MRQLEAGKRLKQVACTIILPAFSFVIFWASAVSAVQPDAAHKEQEARGQDEFELVMSKNDSACKPLLTILNKYLIDDDRIPSQAQGEDLALVSWEPIALGDRVSTDQVIEKALLDINNDGKKELVVRHKGSLRSQMTESLFIFPSGSDVLSKLKPGQGGLAPLFATPDKIDFRPRDYVLKDLPMPIREKLMEDLKKQMSELLKKGLIKEENLAPARIGGVLVLQPFVWRNSVYILMTDLHQEWIVISKYKSGETLEDICYFHGPDRLKPE